MPSLRRQKKSKEQVKEKIVSKNKGKIKRKQTRIYLEISSNASQHRNAYVKNPAEGAATDGGDTIMTTMMVMRIMNDLDSNESDDANDGEDNYDSKKEYFVIQDH